MELTLENIAQEVFTLKGAYNGISGDVKEIKKDTRELYNKTERDKTDIKTDLTAKIAETETKLYAKIAETETKLYAKIAETETKLNGKIDETKAELKEDIRELFNKTERDKTELIERIERGNASLKTELIQWMVGLLVGFATIIITAMWAILSFAIK